MFRSLSFLGKLDGSSSGPVPGQDRALGAMEFTASPKPQLSSRANAFSIAALMSSGGSKEKEATENTIKPLGKSGCQIVGRRGSAALLSLPLSPGCGRPSRVANHLSRLEAVLTLRPENMRVGEFSLRPKFFGPLAVC